MGVVIGPPPYCLHHYNTRYPGGKSELSSDCLNRQLYIPRWLAMCIEVVVMVHQCSVPLILQSPSDLTPVPRVVGSLVGGVTMIQDGSVVVSISTPIGPAVNVNK